MTDPATLDAIDPHFVRDLTRSHAHVEAVAAWLRRLGKTVEVMPLRVRPTVHDRLVYGDDGDLRVNGKRCEAKERQLAFTGAHDFPYRTIIVDVAHSWDRADPKPWGYFLTNRTLTHCAVVRGTTADRWLRTERYDAARGRARRYVECPVPLVQFCPIT